MKKTITLLSLLLFVGVAFSQSLQFNQVKLVTSNETVPADKVWKVTEFLPSDGRIYTSSSTPYIHSISVNGTKVNVGHGAWNFNNGSETRFSSAYFLPNPLWFTAGTVLDPSVSGYNLYGMSVIEFNVIP